MENTSKNFFETMTEMQKKVVENFNDATAKIQKNFSKNDYMDSDPFKKWYDSQMSFFNQNNNTKGNNEPMDFFNNWMDAQTNFTKNWMEQTQKAITNLGNDAKNMPSMDFYNNWMNTMNKTYSEMMKNFSSNNEGVNSFSGMFNNAQNYMKMFELWMPVMNSIQDKTFTTDMFKSAFNAEMYKNFMDSIFNMQPEYMKNLMTQYEKAVKEGMQTLNEQGKNIYSQFSNNMHKGFGEGEQAFDKFNTLYKSYSENLNQTFSPLMKLVTPGTQKEQMEQLSNLSNEFSNYNMLNNKMQYMIYTTGIKSMEEVAENVSSKLKDGVDMSNFKNIYQEWLNINDKNFVSLFESDEYSKLQGEFNATDMKIKAAVNQQWEKSLSHLPLINRTEMDQLYKTVYELKKQVSELIKFNKDLMNKAFSPAAVSTEETKTASTASKTATKAAAKK